MSQALQWLQNLSCIVFTGNSNLEIMCNITTKVVKIKCDLQDVWHDDDIVQNFLI